MTFSEKEDGKSQEFSMISGKVRSKEEHIQKIKTLSYLKFAAIYGANSAGKSNFIKALDLFKRFVLQEPLPSSIVEMYCKADPANKNKPTYFEAEILIKEHIYLYGFEINLSKNKIETEWLYEIISEKEKLLFEKETSNAEYKFGSELDFPDLKSLSSFFSSTNTLLLTFLNKNMEGFYKKHSNALFLRQIYNWFFNTLSINFPDAPIPDASFLIDEGAFEDVSNLMKALGTGVSKVISEPVEPDTALSGMKKFDRDILEAIVKKNNDVLQGNKKLKTNVLIRNGVSIYIVNIDAENNYTASEILFKHNFKDDTPQKYFWESDGTKRLFELLEILLTKHNKTYVIDELDRRLHPCLTYEFVKLYFEYAQKRNIQLIVTTHESRLLDFDLLRRDEIWFINKNDSGKSDIYSLEEFNERFDKKIDKAYLEGRYQGIPLFSTIFPIKMERR